MQSTVRQWRCGNHSTSSGIIPKVHRYFSDDVGWAFSQAPVSNVNGSDQAMTLARLVIVGELHPPADNGTDAAATGFAATADAGLRRHSSLNNDLGSVCGR